MIKTLKKPIALFVLFEIIISVIYASVLISFLKFLDHNIYGDLYSYIYLIPFISFFLFFQKKEHILAKINRFSPLGILIIIAGIILYIFSQYFRAKLSPNDYFSMAISSWLIISLGGFLLFCGKNAFIEAMPALCFLVFMIPIPSPILNWYIEFLRKASETVSYYAFVLLGIPVFKTGNLFQLPNYTLEVARQCSGVRSSIGLWITAFLSSCLFLHKLRYRLLVLLSVIPIAIIKNGLRIVTLGILASYVDPIYITNHWLHKGGGVLYFGIALFLLFFPWLFFVRQLERKSLSK